MKRRGFLQAIGAGAAIIMLPSLAANPTPALISESLPLATTADLTAWMGTRFACHMGEPRAFFELPIAEAVRRFGCVDVDKNAELVRFTYKTIAIGIEGDDPVEAEKRLVIAMAERLEQIEAHQPIVWRLQPQFTSEQITEFGDTWMTREEIEDRVDIPYAWGETEWMKRTHDRYLVQWKFRPTNTLESLPPINVPEGVEHDVNTDSLKYVKRKYTLNKLRMRLTFPHMLDDDFADVLNINCEGRPTVRI